MASVTIKVDYQKFRSIMEQQLLESARKGAKAAQGKVRENIMAIPRVDTGRMAASVGVRQVGPATFRVHSGMFYTMYQEMGTRAHGPVRAKALRFKPKGSSKVVFAQRVRGIEPGRFFAKTPSQMNLRDFI